MPPTIEFGLFIVSLFFVIIKIGSWLIDVKQLLTDIKNNTKKRD